ncbi:DUF6907 domain-containing protein [Streptomyces albireticuli]|uniref:Uncharacterized protein n=1 Tax=Streptomyces albireticuli TaxID=1940 RepID=A0A2A2D546_9ACTN|nr:hypothetical protein [Streptomyces albireticuli]MCD9196041.1 hypothetical protein [Streptomyces albireticuli]PAU46567.1 hypothetical protein CK936_23530 [Streptomyces albireticuli]
MAEATIPSQPSAPAAPAPLSHPTVCPSWCRDRQEPAAHHFGPTATWHWSPQYRLSNPRPLEGDVPVILRSELYRSDEESGTGEVKLYLSGETDIDLGRDEADVLIADLDAFVATLRVLRRQMG